MQKSAMVDVVNEKKFASKGVLSVHFTKSYIRDFVSRHYAGFSAPYKIRGILKFILQESAMVDVVNGKKFASDRSEE